MRNVWQVYEDGVANTFPNMREKLQKNVVSFTHTGLCVLLMSLYNLGICNTLYLNVLLSTLYYEHDVKNHHVSDTMGRIMIVHHVVAILLLSCTFILENPIWSLAFLYIEISNLPLYMTQIVIHSQNKDLWRPYFKWCVLTEFMSFLIFRCILLYPFIFMCQYKIVAVLLFIVYVAGLIWTVKLGIQLISLFSIRQRP